MATKSLWPATSEQIRAAGFELGRFAHCSGRTCNAFILWVKTPNGKMMPLQKCGIAGGSGRPIYEPHFASCPDRKKFLRH